jgi:hypothetical protein
MLRINQLPKLLTVDPSGLWEFQKPRWWFLLCSPIEFFPDWYFLLLHMSIFAGTETTDGGCGCFSVKA